MDEWSDHDIDHRNRLLRRYCITFYLITLGWNTFLKHCFVIFTAVRVGVVTVVSVILLLNKRTCFSGGDWSKNCYSWTYRTFFLFFPHPIHSLIIFQLTLSSRFWKRAFLFFSKSKQVKEKKKSWPEFLGSTFIRWLLLLTVDS